MATAANLFHALSESLGRSFGSIEAYGLALRQHNWWEKTKRGRGASPLDDAHAAKLLLAILSSGPNDISGVAENRSTGHDFFTTYSTTCVSPSQLQDPIHIALREELKLSKRAVLLDYITAFVRLYRENKTDKLIYHSPNPDETQNEYSYDGPQIELRIKGPMPIAEVRFQLSPDFVGNLEDKGYSPEDIARWCIIPFVPSLYAGAAKAEDRGDPSEIQASFEKLRMLREATARGIRFERSIGGREFDAVAKALRGSAVAND